MVGKIKIAEEQWPGQEGKDNLVSIKLNIFKKITLCFSACGVSRIPSHKKKSDTEKKESVKIIENKTDSKMCQVS